MNAEAQALPSLDARYRRWRWQIFAITWLAYFGFYLTRKPFSVVKSELAKPAVLGLTNHQMSYIDGGYLIAYAVGMMLWGMCGDRFGTRKVILGGLIGSVLSAIAMGQTSSWTGLAVFFTLQGIFQSTGWAPLAKNVTTFFSQNERGVIMGLWCTNYAIGGFVATNFAGDLAEWFGWRAAFYVPAVTLAVIFVLFLFFQRDRPEDVGLPAIEVYHREEPPPAAVPAADTPSLGEGQSRWSAIWEVLGNPMVLLLAAIYFCLKPARYAILFWGPKYVSERLGSGMAESGRISSMFELAGPVSVIVAGFISDKLFGARRMPVSVICLFLLGILLATLDYLPHKAWMLGSGLFLIGILTYAPDSLVSGTAAVDFGTKKGASTASGLINAAGSLGSIVGGTVPGIFHDQWGWGGVFGFLGGAVIVAGILLLPKWNALPDAMNAKS